MFCTEPNAPTNLQVTATVNSLAASWTAPTPGAVTSYTVTLKEGSRTKDAKTVVSGAAATFAGLTAGKEYTVAVVSVAGVLSSGGQNSDPLSHNFYTSKSVKTYSHYILLHLELNFCIYIHVTPWCLYNCILVLKLQTEINLKMV